MIRVFRVSLVFYTFLVLCLSNCADSTEKKINTNQIKISIVKSIGDTTTLLARGDSASYSCSILGSKINGLSSSGSNIELSFLGTPYGCVSSPDTYSLLGRYYQDYSNIKSAVYSNYAAKDPMGKITFSKANDQIKEGTFYVICFCESQISCSSDSIQILGTFILDEF